MDLKMNRLLPFILLTLFIQSCSPTESISITQNPQTEVRLLSLSYEKDIPLNDGNQINSIHPKNNIKKSSSENTFIYPGDILTFTVELEDPNYEFLSILAIKFNGQTIRANSDDSIVSTRDCGANICVDFPFEVLSQVTEYVVEEVRFAKVSGESGISAIIDTNSANKVVIDVWESATHPYVEPAVATINEMLKQVDYFSLETLSEMLINSENRISHIESFFKSRTLKIINPERMYLADGTNAIQFESELDLLQLVNKDSYGPTDRPSVQLIEMFSGTDSYLLHWLFQGELFYVIDEYFSEYFGTYTLNVPTNLYFGLLDESFANVFAYNQQNDIYLSINGVDQFLYQMGRETQIITY